MKVDTARMAAIARGWPDDLRAVLLCGYDESASRDTAAAVAAQFATPENPAAIEELTGKQVASDPQALIAAVSAISMFGDHTLVRVDGLDDEGVSALEAVLKGPRGNPVLAVAGGLKKGSPLLALAEAAPDVAVLISQELNAGNAARTIADMALPMGLRVGREAADLLFQASEGDRQILRRELEKLALFKDADPARPTGLEPEDVMAIAVGAGDAEMVALVAAAVAGRATDVIGLLSRRPAGIGIPLLRALERRLALLLTLRSDVEQGATPAAAVAGARPPVFWKDKVALTDEVSFWTLPALAAAMADMLSAERSIKQPASLGDVVADAAVLNVARRASALRKHR